MFDGRLENAADFRVGDQGRELASFAPLFRHSRLVFGDGERANLPLGIAVLGAQRIELATLFVRQFLGAAKLGEPRANVTGPEFELLLAGHRITYR